MKIPEDFPKALRALAELYFDGVPIIKHDVGICYNLTEITNKSVYEVMQVAMGEIGYWGSFRTEQGKVQLHSIEDWQSRAWMCLFLAEYLETK